MIRKITELLLIGVVSFFLIEAIFYSCFIKIKNLDYNITTVYKVLPVLIIYGNVDSYSFNTETPEALSFGFTIVLNKNYGKDELTHELVHAKQYYRYCLMSPLLYIISQKYRVAFEYEAYMSETKRISNEEFVDHMYNYYDITLDKKDIYKIMKIVI